MIKFLNFIILLLINQFQADVYKFGDHNYESLVNVLLKIHSRCINVSRVYTLDDYLGHNTTSQGRKLYVIEFFDKRLNDRDIKKLPNVKYVSNMHGNEIVGRELCLKLMDELCQVYIDEPTYFWKIIGGYRLHIMPSMNPDGYEIAYGLHYEIKTHTNILRDKSDEWLRGRNNGNNKDLNRNFPNLTQLYLRNYISLLCIPLDLKYSQREIETRMVMKWLHDYQFTLSLNFHGGDRVVNYPFDTSEFGTTTFSPTPDHKTFVRLAKQFVKLAPSMKEHHNIPKNQTVPSFYNNNEGITNGAQCCFELTVELNEDKFPFSTHKLEKMWKAYKDALLFFPRMLKERITVYLDMNPKYYLFAWMDIYIRIGNDYALIENPLKMDCRRHYYHRLLAPGIYRIKLNAISSYGFYDDYNQYDFDSFVISDIESTVETKYFHICIQPNQSRETIIMISNDNSLVTVESNFYEENYTNIDDFNMVSV
ncbi:hypothetical protein A3Q56_01370 [Intoshia linei]|uniref:Peptidase M14 domain-containing protein n=1 Tax=Intoshia linei TaxID=1819745 RepID=A0A177BB53_9BILA|nr:hypothetical protein A3Q56_01370 [Intoshia linei]